jgi:predicted CopG family antitoxin
MSKYTAFRCPEDLLELAKVKAKKDRRSLSNYIITLIEKDVKVLIPVLAAGKEAKEAKEAKEGTKGSKSRK